MIVAPVIIGTIIFLLMALSPCIFAFTFKSKVCDGYCLGFCIFILTSLLLGITLLIVFFIGALLFRIQLMKLIRLSLDLDIYSIVKYEPLWFLLFMWGAFAICFLEIFLVLNGLIKKKYNSPENKSKIFTFFSGYILPLSVVVLDLIFASFRISVFGNFTYFNGNCIFIIVELLVVVFSLNILGTILMLFVQHNNDNNNNLRQRIKWICIGNFFGPLLVGLIGIFTTAYIFYLAIIFYVSPLILGVYFYCNYIYEQKPIEDEVEHINNSNENLITDN